MAAGPEALKKFGKYFLLDMIAQGGMAEIYRARLATPDGGSRLVAIKRISGSYAQNPEFKKMFRAEIRTTSGFAHPNIVQLYDYGEEESLPYIAMELVDGRNLRQFISRFGELKSTFPIEVSIYIIEQAALGLVYAHGYKDRFSGKSLNIVHRDISPQNILISYDGAVKVIDFGIAKAITDATTVEATRAGVIKGKPSYLSPEQISGDPLDGRSDIFALGGVLWELLAGRKLFTGENDYAVLKLIENCSSNVKPPSLHNRDVPKELDAIVLKCLQKNRAARYASAEELQRALHKFLYQFSPEFNPADLAYYARDLFKNEIVEDRKRLLKLNQKIEQMLSAQAVLAAAQAGGETEESTITLAADPRTEASAPSEEPASPRPSAPTSPTPPVRTPSVTGKSTDSGSFRVVEVVAEKTNTNVELELGPGGKKAVVGSGEFAPVGKNSYRRGGSAHGGGKEGPSRSSPAAAVALLAVALGGGGYWYLTTQMGGRQAAREPSGLEGTLTLQGTPRAVTILVDDKVAGNSLPATLKGLPTDRAFRLSVSSNGYRKYSEEVRLGAGEKRGIDVALKREDGPARAGAPAEGAAVEQGGAERGSSKVASLRLNITPPGLGTQIRIDGAPVDVAGITNQPMGQPIELVVEREGFRLFRRTFVIDPAGRADGSEYVLDVPLQAARFGYVSIKTTPSAEAVLTIDGNEERWPTPISRKRIPVGTYKARLVNSLLGMEKDVTFTISEDRFTNIEERLSVQDDATRAPGSR